MYIPTECAARRAKPINNRACGPAFPGMSWLRVTRSRWPSTPTVRVAAQRQAQPDLPCVPTSPRLPRTPAFCKSTVRSTMTSVEDSWGEATEGLDEAVRDAWLTRLLASYSEERRTYHNLDSLREKLLLYQEIKESLKNPRAVLLALLFQNFEYDPKALDEENKNLEHFTTFAAEAGIPDDSELLTETQALLRAASTHSTEAHKVGGAYGGEDAHYLLDLDMAALGSDPDKYVEYRDKIRGEYPFLSEPLYTALRLKVLQNFLQIPNIFATKEFRERFEEQARANIQSEIEQLS